MATPGTSAFSRWRERPPKLKATSLSVWTATDREGQKTLDFTKMTQLSERDTTVTMTLAQAAAATTTDTDMADAPTPQGAWGTQDTRMNRGAATTATPPPTITETEHTRNTRNARHHADTDALETADEGGITDVAPEDEDEGAGDSTDTEQEDMETQTSQRPDELTQTIGTRQETRKMRTAQQEDGTRSSTEQRTTTWAHIIAHQTGGQDTHYRTPEPRWEEEERAIDWSNDWDPTAHWRVIISKFMAPSREIAEGTETEILHHITAHAPWLRQTFGVIKTRMEYTSTPRDERTGKHYQELAITAPPEKILEIARRLIEHIPTKLVSARIGGGVLTYRTIQLKAGNIPYKELIALTEERGTRHTIANMRYVLKAMEGALDIYPPRLLNLALLDYTKPTWRTEPEAEIPGWYAKATYGQKHPWHQHSPDGSRHEARYAGPARPMPLVGPKAHQQRDYRHRDIEKAYHTATSPRLTGYKRTRHSAATTPEELLASEGIPTPKSGMGLNETQLHKLLRYPRLYQWLKMLQGKNDEHQQQRVATLAAHLARINPDLTLQQAAQCATEMAARLHSDQFAPRAPDEVIEELKSLGEEAQGQVAVAALSSEATRQAMLQAITT